MELLERALHGAGGSSDATLQSSDGLRGVVGSGCCAASDKFRIVRDGAISNEQCCKAGGGDFFGEMAFLDGCPRSAEATAIQDSELYVLSRDAFDRLASEHKSISLNIFEGFARILAGRLRSTITELRASRS